MYDVDTALFAHLCGLGGDQELFPNGAAGGALAISCVEPDQAA
jgi:hypothetical protein